VTWAWCWHVMEDFARAGYDTERAGRQLRHGVLERAWPHLCVQPLYDLSEGLEAVSRKIFRDMSSGRAAELCGEQTSRLRGLARCDCIVDYGPLLLHMGELFPHPCTGDK
jgi:hypothetical protein